MDWAGLKNKGAALFKKYRFALLILLAGAVLLLIPGKSNKQTEQIKSEQVQTVTVTDELTEILRSIKGVGKVQVMLTIASGEKTTYEYDEEIHSGENGSVRKNVVVITDGNRNEYGLVTQVTPPEYLGAVVVCEGADHASVRLSVVEAVSKATGLGADRISVLKMKEVNFLSAVSTRQNFWPYSYSTNITFPLCVGPWD